MPRRGVDRAWVVDALDAVDALDGPEMRLNSIGVDASVRRALRQHLVG